ncbi:fumarylacetoacetate hydrolase family protein [Variovorax sp. PCZ-1]|uniref:fumarylacetoacetate hydrolase family protein n=1 Tax=Variovorax sp. PCZ-1 TaxID=2835533 RepID=UPI001BCB3160|nr:fumarylacetoacetate hydrolase family protein [Variovorax sp. PCZ-1]MBS7806311.1 fumarylacetoacetate hydrolase family protein [Variovorax sp. PCZ-1]
MTSPFPQDADRAVLIARVHTPSLGAVLALATPEALYDLSSIAPTSADLLAMNDPAAQIAAKRSQLPKLADMQAVLGNSQLAEPDHSIAHLLAPCDLQPIKAAGVTFVASMLERVIEEQARGDASKALAVREKISKVIGDNLRAIVPGSDKAMQVKALLMEMGLWSQYLEVGIGKDAEVFTKSQAMSAVGYGAQIGIHPESHWNNPEPEVVLAVSPQGIVQGVALGNDVNLRDVEGRSALLLGKAKDNNASCAIGPFIRLFDANFTIDDARQAEVRLVVTDDKGFMMEGSSSMQQISRDPLNLVAQTLNANHQYPDGFMLFCGTMFAPTQDRFAKGQGFTHAVGDCVTVSSPRLGELTNWVNTCDQITPWTYGSRALMRDLARRGLL